MEPASCPLLRAPLDIRLNIYDYFLPDHGQFHVCLEQDKVVLAPCVNPDPKDKSPASQLPTDAFRNSEIPTGNERGYDKDMMTICDNDVWARRLRSTWGPHWECEEKSREQDQEGMADANAILHVCRKMHSEFLDLLVSTAVVHMTDLETIDKLNWTGPVSSLCSATSRSLLQNIVRLSITLRLPWNFFPLAKHRKEVIIQDERLAYARRIWFKLNQTLGNMNKLRRLRLWLDHGDAGTWSDVNEKKALNHLTKLACLEELNFLILLPKLHPKYETEACHFIHPGPPVPFNIHRVLRQRIHGDETVPGTFQVVESPDFPFLLDIDEYLDLPLEEVEEEERKRWAEGEDVERYVEEYIDILINGPPGAGNI
ncbi:hypothetical protein P154DRAFT_521180 [Amniculicola lignicola CBS 123094]|uniref:DUF7730 domain-containing protein n=1 Tax=Amniculicola lignicola CBS 123094 TaxID=1392246 RepID=A0A6A5WMM1_9PLEO|nr:hypothetical protein P154DRAFT_521180 [Amniculicola lignicola CBS 123094]